MYDLDTQQLMYQDATAALMQRIVELGVDKEQTQAQAFFAIENHPSKPCCQLEQVSMQVLGISESYIQVFVMKKRKMCRLHPAGLAHVLGHPIACTLQTIPGMNPVDMLIKRCTGCDLCDTGMCSTLIFKPTIAAHMLPGPSRNAKMRAERPQRVHQD